MLHEDIKKSYQDLVEAHDFARVGSWEMDLKKNKSYWSEEAYRIYGISSEQYDGTFESFLNLIHPEDRELVRKQIMENKSESPFHVEYRILRLDGSVRSIRHMLKPFLNQEGDLVHLCGTVQDHTVLRDFNTLIGQTEDTIDQIQKRFQVLVQRSRDVFEIISTDLTILYISPAVEKIIGYLPEERVGKSALEHMDEVDRKAFIKKVAYVMEYPEQTQEGDVALKDRHGNISYLTYTLCNQLDEPSIRGIVINWRDITERVENQKEIEHIATHDELTQLPNRVYLKRMMNQLCEQGTSAAEDFALIMLNIDGFRYVNDALGYQYGDQLIIQVAERITGMLQKNSLVCRYSGDQFAIIVRNLHKSWEYEQVAKKITNLFHDAYKVELYELDMTVSMGISMFPHDEKNPDLLINYANISLLRSKHEGKNRYKFYSSELGIQIYKQVVLRNDLMKAIERNQFEVYYQAQVKLESSDILAAEALIRWHHPEWGMVSPNEFISLAEESGFIINLGNWMLEEVCKNYKKWMDQGMSPIKISVNYSSIQFFERNFADNIFRIINKYELEPQFLIMEITESVFMKNPEKAILDIKRLKEAGIQVALDDFGTGFSSLSYLNSFSIDILKIDRSFIKNVMVDDASTIITKSVIDLAQELKIKLVAEGIENEEQLSYLKGLHCYTGQGFLYNKPMPTADFEKVLLKEKCLPEDAILEQRASLENRKYLRIKLPSMLSADMSVVEQSDKKFKLGSTKVAIKNISSEGLCFVSGVRLPVNPDMTLRFSISMGDQKKAQIYGFPTWTHEVEEGIYETGIEFNHQQEEKAELVAELYKICKQMHGFA